MHSVAVDPADNWWRLRSLLRCTNLKLCI